MFRSTTVSFYKCNKYISCILIFVIIATSFKTALGQTCIKDSFVSPESLMKTWDLERSKNDSLTGSYQIFNSINTRNQVLNLFVSKSKSGSALERKRSEIRLNQQLYPDSLYTIGFDVFIPSDWIDETETLQQDIVSQFLMTQPNPKCSFRPSVYLAIRGEEWVIVSNYGSINLSKDGKEINCNTEYFHEDQVVLFKSPLEKGIWVQWKFEVQFSAIETDLVVWKNNNICLDLSNQIKSNQIKSNIIWYDIKNNGVKVKPQAWNFKLGLYKPQWYNDSLKSLTTTRSIYFDNFIFCN